MGRYEVPMDEWNHGPSEVFARVVPRGEHPVKWDYSSVSVTIWTEADEAPPEATAPEEPDADSEPQEDAEEPEAEDKSPAAPTRRRGRKRRGV